MFAHEMDVSKPPPPIDDSFPHPSLLEQLRVSDAQRVQQFLSTSKHETNQKDDLILRSTVPVDISTYGVELCKALKVLENLKHSKLVLDELVQQDKIDTKWTEELDRAEQLKGILQDILEPLENVERKQFLHQKLTARRKKRAWLKRRHKRLQSERTAEQKVRIERLQEIASWESEWKDRLNRERIAREELQKKTLILTDVRQRKARAKRMLTRFEKSLHLCQQRQNQAVDTQSKEQFVSRMNALIAEWKGKVGECVKEEKRLQDELNRQSIGNVSRRRENRWRKVLFGTAAAIGGIFGHQSKDWWQELIVVRRAWDKYSLPAYPDQQLEQGRMVNTWIVPPEQPLPEWEVYRETNKIEQ
ncbi:uncharacterized protein LOC126558406 [Anopheles maculipalpis]|uniref:uncharacterized protein LOC126558406 n=1 Tax=Anopheles maculipalpis TaxID=1496333 RepID=UPI00215951DA|nr:uncharacterized protein LOC126558406 [Anopheles maculipalpis]